MTPAQAEPDRSNDYAYGHYLGIAMAVCMGIGAGIGAATGKMGLWVAIGAGLAPAIAAVLSSATRNRRDEDAAADSKARKP
jgi:hypothetical protein